MHIKRVIGTHLFVDIDTVEPTHFSCDPCFSSDFTVINNTVAEVLTVDHV